MSWTHRNFPWIVFVVLIIVILTSGCTTKLSTVDANGNEAYASCPEGKVKMPTLAPPMVVVCIPKY